jgi:hypothetical protein
MTLRDDCSRRLAVAASENERGSASLWLAAKDGKLMPRPDADTKWKSSPRKFHVLLHGATALGHPWAEPWGNSFSGRFTAAQLADILAAFDAAKAFLICWALDDDLGEEGRELLDAAFARAADIGFSRLRHAFPVPPAMFAAGNGLAKAADALISNSAIDADPDREIDGGASAFAGALLHGNRPDIAAIVLQSNPSVRSIQEALEMLEEELLERADPSNMPPVDPTVLGMLRKAMRGKN